MSLPAYLSKVELNSKFNADLTKLTIMVKEANDACDLYNQEIRKKCIRTITSKEVGDKLENAVHYMLSSTSEVFVPYGASSTNTSQIDNTVEVSLKQGFLDRWPPYILVECKNWATKMGKQEVSDFIKKLEDANVHVGIIFSRKGITGSQYKDATGKITLAANRGTVTLVLSNDHIQQICSGENLFDILEREYRLRALSPA